MTHAPALPLRHLTLDAGAPSASGAAGASRQAQRRARQVEDLRLVRAIKDARHSGGDEDAFRQLVERYQRRLYWLAYDILLDRDEARDVTQEAFLRVYRAIDRYDTRRDFVNWIYRIARNLAIDLLRRRRRRAVPVAVSDDAAERARSLAGAGQVAPGGSEGPEPSASPIRSEAQARVHAILERLPVPYRTALTLRDLHGLAPREIAQITDCSYPTARWRLHRGRAMFRDLWEATYGAAPGMDPVEDAS